MASNIYYSVNQCFPWIPLRVDGSSVADGFLFDSIFLHCEEKTNEVSLWGDTFVGDEVIVGVLANEELDVLELELVLLHFLALS